MIENPLDVQVNGNHYKNMKIQPIEFCQVNKIPWCESNVIKYVCRHKLKNGLDDLLKAKHYIDVLISLEYGGNKQTVETWFVLFCSSLWEEIQRADTKHGDWSNMSIEDCLYHISDEVKELKIAALNNDINGNHGIKAESLQVACTAAKTHRKVNDDTNRTKI